MQTTMQIINNDGNFDVKAYVRNTPFSTPIIYDRMLRQFMQAIGCSIKYFVNWSYVPFLTIKSTQDFVPSLFRSAPAIVRGLLRPFQSLIKITLQARMQWYSVIFSLSFLVTISLQACPNGWRQSSVIPNKCYLIAVGKRIWFDAESYCSNAASNGHLTSITSAYELYNLNGIFCVYL